MNGFFIGYGLVACAVAVVLHGQPFDAEQPGHDHAARIVMVAIWPIPAFAAAKVLMEKAAE